ncbi:MAG: hypothetical protein Q4B69_05775 [Slackia sp.]|nr:hypothetical protein [Slackia sp.]
MIKQEYSKTRTRATWKPRVTAEDLPFFEDEASHTMFLGIAGATDVYQTGTGRTLVAELPYAHLEPEVENARPEKIELIDEENLPEEITMTYRIDGGFNNNCILFSWSIAQDAPYELSWVALKTFTGMQMKYVLPKKRSPLVFALADEDAFAYCNKIPCEECAFRCKSGFAIYACFKGLGIVRMTLDRISMLNLEQIKR